MSNIQKFSLHHHVKALLNISVAIIISLFSQNNLHAEESIISDISKSGLSWGRKYFFDSPRFKDNNVQEQLDKEIIEKLNSYGIYLEKAINSSKYLLNYTILLGDTASQTEIEDLYIEDPELENIPKDSAKFERGKLLISIRVRDSHKAIWRSSVEGLTNLDMPEEIRAQRIRAFINAAFATFPK